MENYRKLENYREEEPWAATLGTGSSSPKQITTQIVFQKRTGFKFVDDLSTIEVINLLTIGLSSFNMKSQVPSDIPIHGQYVEGKNLKSQTYLNEINEWTQNQKMIISEKKTKMMLFNFTDKYQFTTRLSLKGTNIQVVDQMKILGTIVKTNLSWDDNCHELIRKVNARMQLLRGVQSFGASKDEMVHLWIIFCRSVLEHSCGVWHSSLTQENIDDLERTQKTFTKLVLKEKYLSYEDSLIKLNLDPLSQRRQALSLKFAKDGLKYEQLKDLLPINMKEHNMKIRQSEKYKVNFANTERLKNGSVIMMQNYLNEDDKQNKTRNCG